MAFVVIPATAPCTIAPVLSALSPTSAPHSVRPVVAPSRRRLLQQLALSCVALPLLAAPAMSADAPEITDLKVGDGAEPRKGDTLFVHYTLTLNGFQDNGGSMVDSSHSRKSLFSYVIHSHIYHYLLAFFSPLIDLLLSLTDFPFAGTSSIRVPSSRAGISASPACALVDIVV